MRFDSFPIDSRQGARRAPADGTPRSLPMSTLDMPGRVETCGARSGQPSSRRTTTRGRPPVDESVLLTSSKPAARNVDRLPT